VRGKAALVWMAALTACRARLRGADARQLPPSPGAGLCGLRLFGY
jgi:hypothetical protein